MSNENKYVTVLFPVRLTKEDIPHLIDDTKDVNGLVTIVQGNLVASAKSLIGLLNLDFNEAMDMLIQGYVSEEQLNTLKGYEWRKNS
jgi:hypothetical protein